MDGSAALSSASSYQRVGLVSALAIGGGLGVTTSVLGYLLWKKMSSSRGESAFRYSPSRPHRSRAAADAPDNALLVHITGFGKFQGVPSNPTTVLATKIIGHLEAHPLSHASVSVRTSEVLETSAVGSLMQLVTMRANARSECKPSSLHVWLHLGVNARASHFALEKMCYNEATFRCADERNWRACEQPIDSEEGPVTHTRHTTLEVDGIVGRLADKGHRVFASTDPGRFVCNWVYYHSLRLNDVESDNSCSLFVHVPPFSKIPEKEQMKFLCDLLEELAVQKIIEETHGGSLD